MDENKVYSVNPDKTDLLRKMYAELDRYCTAENNLRVIYSNGKSYMGFMSLNEGGVSLMVLTDAVPFSNFGCIENIQEIKDYMDNLEDNFRHDHKIEGDGPIPEDKIDDLHEYISADWDVFLRVSFIVRGERMKHYIDGFVYFVNEYQHTIVDLSSITLRANIRGPKFIRKIKEAYIAFRIRWFLKKSKLEERIKELRFY